MDMGLEPWIPFESASMTFSSVQKFKRDKQPRKIATSGYYWEQIFCFSGMCSGSESRGQGFFFRFQIIIYKINKF